MRSRFFSLFIIVFSTISAQEIPHNSWRNHFSFQSAKTVSSGNGKVFCGTENGLFYYDINNKTSRKINKMMGLGEVGITALKYIVEKDLLILGYHTGMIDLVYPDRIQNINTIREIEAFENKAILDFEYVENEIYAATEIGIVLIDLVAEEARDVYNEIGINGESISVSHLEIFQDSLYAISNQGLFNANLGDNLLDFNNWNMLVSNDTADLSDIETSTDSIMVILNSSELYKYSSGKWDLIYESSDGIVDLVISENILFGLEQDKILKWAGNEVETMYNGIFENAKSLVVNNENYYVADYQLGLINLDGTSIEYVSPNGPMGDYPTKVNFSGQDIYFTYGKPVNSWEDLDGIDKLSGGLWDHLQIPNFHNITDISTFQDQIFVTSFGNGLYNLSQGNQTSEFISHFLTDLAVTEDQMWLADYDGSASLHSSDNGLEWESHSIPNSRYPKSIQVSIGKTIWITRDNLENGGIAVHNPLENQSRILDFSDGLPVNDIEDIVIDQKDEALIATRDGVVFFFDASFVFQNEEALSPFFDAGSLTQNDEFTSLAIDGGNRRWFGTTKGLYLYDENLATQFHHFTSENSPLPSNNVLDLFYNETTGEIFVMTERGMVSYQSVSSKSQTQHRQVRFLPNPVSRGSQSGITIIGLTGNATLRITDIRGNIVSEINAYGSTASWNLRSLQGRKALPGVYLIFSSNESGEETFIGKFVVVP